MSLPSVRLKNLVDGSLRRVTLPLSRGAHLVDGPRSVTRRARDPLDTRFPVQVQSQRYSLRGPGRPSRTRGGGGTRLTKTRSVVGTFHLEY